MKTGEACEGIALKYAEECAVFDAVTDVRTVAVVIDGRGQRRVLLRQRADVRRDGAGRLALFIDPLRAAHGIVQGEFPNQRCCGIVTFDGEQLEAFLIAAALKEGRTPYCHVVDGNEASLHLQRKMGLTCTRLPAIWVN